MRPHEAMTTNFAPPRRRWRTNAGGSATGVCILLRQAGVSMNHKRVFRLHAKGASPFVGAAAASGRSAHGHRWRSRKGRTSEFTSNAILAWANQNGAEWHYIAPGKPMQNGFVGASLRGTFGSTEGSGTSA